MSDSEDWKLRKDYLLKNYPVEALLADALPEMLMICCSVLAAGQMTR